MRAVLIVAVLVACSRPAPSPPPETIPAPAPSTVLEPLPPVELPPCREAAAGERDAITQAEAYVRDQGYTDAPVPDTVEIVPEGLEAGSDRASRIEARHGMLEAAALGVFPHEGSSEEITVVFRYTETRDAYRHGSVGRAVTVSSDGRPRLAHQDALLSAVQPICPPTG